MKVLREFIELSDMQTLEEAINLSERDLATVMQKHGNASVAQFNNLPMGATLEDRLGEVEKRFAAARRGLSLANKLKTPEERKANKSRIMRNLNLIRQIVGGITNELERQQGRWDDLRQAAQDHDDEHNAIPGKDRWGEMKAAAGEHFNKPATQFNQGVQKTKNDMMKPSFLGRMADRFRGRK